MVARLVRQAVHTTQVPGGRAAYAELGSAQGVVRVGVGMSEVWWVHVTVYLPSGAKISTGWGTGGVQSALFSILTGLLSGLVTDGAVSWSLG